MYYLASRIQTELLNIAYGLQVVVELNGPIFWETESIRQVNRIELIRFELRIGMHYSVVPLSRELL